MGDTNDAGVAAMLALVDELPLLFADDEQPQLADPALLLHPPAAHVAERTVAHHQRPSQTAPMSSAQVTELLRSIDSPQHEQQHLRHNVQSRASPPRKQRGANGKAKKKTKKPAAMTASSKACDGRKEELMYLRKTVLELETRLSVLKVNAKKNNHSSSSSPSRIITQEISKYNGGGYKMQKATRSLVVTASAHDRRERDDALDDVWREIARHQCDERDRSERENIRLRMVLESQLKVARSLEKFLTLKSAATMDITKSIDTRQRYHRFPKNSNLSDDPTETEIFQNLLDGVEQSLAEVNEVYEANGLARMERTQMSAQMRFDPTTGMQVEVCAAKALPFGVHETGAAVWNHYMFAKQSMPSRYYSYHSHKSLDANEDTIIEDFSLELHAKNTRAVFRVRQVMRRVVEAESIVIVWRTFFDPREFSEQQLSRVRFFEKGYIVIRKVSPTPTTTAAVSRANVTLLQPCYIIYPHSTTNGGDLSGQSDSVVNGITNFMLSATVANVAATHQMVENVLLEQTLRQADTISGLRPMLSRVI